MLQTDRQTDIGRNITSLSRVIICASVPILSSLVFAVSA